MPNDRDFEKAYKSYARLYPSRKAAECKAAIRSLYASAERLNLKEEDIEELILCTVELFLKVDREINKGETDMLSFVFEDTRLEGKVLAALKDDIVPIEDEWDRYIDQLDEPAKNDVTTIGMCLIAADGEINLREKLLFEKIYR